jgi:hypothetical protein
LICQRADVFLTLPAADLALHMLKIAARARLAERPRGRDAGARCAFAMPPSIWGASMVASAEGDPARVPTLTRALAASTYGS